MCDSFSALPRDRSETVDEDPGRSVGGHRREGEDRVGALGDSQLAGVIVHVGGGELAVGDFSLVWRC